MENLVRFWKGKKVLITGHTGFKGCWLTLWLTKLGAKVIGFSLKDYPNTELFQLTKIGAEIIDERGDVRDKKRVLEVFEKHPPEIVFHLAAQPIVRLSYDFPTETFDTNIMGTVNVLDAIKHSKSIKAAVMITSDKCYENKEWVHGYREDDKMGGHDPYSASKGCMELVVASYRRSFLKEQKKKIATARAGNVIGGGDYAKDRIIPDCVKAINNGITIEIRSPLSIRPWQHVLEPLSGYMLLAQKLFSEEVDEAWNFGPRAGSVVNVKEMVELFLKYWGNGAWKDVSGGVHPHEAKLLALDISKATHKLKWAPKLNFDDTIRLTVDWYKNFKEVGAKELAIKQIEEYEKL